MVKPITSKAVARCALQRTESRGGHTRLDYPKYSDEWALKNSIIRKAKDGGATRYCMGAAWRNPKPRDMDAIVARLRSLHADVTRSQHPLSPALLDRLDAAGILVWQGVGPVDQPGRWSETTIGRFRSALARVRDSVLEARAHPSVLALLPQARGAGRISPAPGSRSRH